MSNQSYKIRVSNEAESREAQELFFALGYSWNSGRTTTDNEKSPYLYTSEDFGLWCGDLHATFNESGKKEITLPQLRDLVVLHRNDYKDANHVDQDGWKWFVSSEGKSYVFGAGNPQSVPRWGESPTELVDLKPIKKGQPQPDQDLISGADALRALADGEIVEYCADKKTWLIVEGSMDLSNFLDTSAHNWTLFRIKPSTITLMLTIPAPFEPKVGESFYVIDYDCMCGYRKLSRLIHGNWDQFGAWRTELEIKQVVAAMQQIKGASV